MGNDDVLVVHTRKFKLVAETLIYQNLLTKKRK